MIIKKAILFLASTVILAACGVASEQKTNIVAPQVKEKQESQWDKNNAFQAEVIPKFEAAVVAEYNTKVGDKTVIDIKAAKEDMDYYIDNDNQKLVILVDKDTTKVGKIKQELTDELGTKIQIKKAKYNSNEMEALVLDVNKTILGMNLDAFEGCYWNLEEQKIDVRADLNQDQIQELKDKYGTDKFNITISKLKQEEF
ncbi:hypothetical protein [Paenibacillus kobensis]|uniref:hypothetical protein n=1 Tax=Paenibacillus kobensis TaxID=59841 RepID=UPI000FD9EF6E|nr:hypothetical protein [Paenibacillus kobensis]